MYKYIEWPHSRNKKGNDLYDIGIIYWFYCVYKKYFFLLLKNGGHVVTLIQISYVTEILKLDR